MIKGFACGIFDLFHAGHVDMLKECRENCDYLVVGLNSAVNIDVNINPGKEKPVFSLDNRKKVLEACRYVDQVVIYNSESELIDIMTSGNFAIRFLGEDYSNKPITGANLIPRIYWINRGHGLSTSLYKEMIRSHESE